MSESVKVLVFDTETTGLFKKRKDDHPEQPWIVQLGAVLFDLKDDRFSKTLNTLVIPPPSAQIDEENYAHAERVHGISLESIYANGRSTEEVLKELRDMRQEADIVAAFNFSFDSRIVRCAEQRTHQTFRDDPVLGHPEEVAHHCIMLHAQAAMRVSRYPSLSKAYEHYFGVPLVGAHDALADAVAAAQLYTALIAGHPPASNIKPTAA